MAIVNLINEGKQTITQARAVELDKIKSDPAYANNFQVRINNIKTNKGQMGDIIFDSVSPDYEYDLRDPLVKKEVEAFGIEYNNFLLTTNEKVFKIEAFMESRSIMRRGTKGIADTIYNSELYRKTKLKFKALLVLNQNI